MEKQRPRWNDTCRYFFVLVIPIIIIHVCSTIRTTEKFYERQKEKETITEALHQPHSFAKAVVIGSRDGAAQPVLQQQRKIENNENLRLRFDWTSLKPLSPLAKAIEEHQNDCRLPQANFWFRNRFGLGSDIHVYSQALCNAIEAGTHRVATISDWIWVDQQVCEASRPDRTSSPMLCYFPSSEPPCPKHDNTFHALHNLTRGRGRIGNQCQALTDKHGIPAFRAASTEFLFTRISQAVQNEAIRQLQLVFKGHDRVPTGLITVHIRWGDKGDEMKLVSIESYIDGVRQLLLQQGHHQDPVRIFLATEDPDAVQAFQNAAPDNWTIYVDHYFHEMLPHRRTTYNGSPLMSKDLHGRPGLVALGSLLVSMEANAWVLTTNSNWSRLMNEIRQSIVDPRCGNCTTMIDLSPGEW
jgi:hypothetical protein